jgi:MFS family permease
MPVNINEYILISSIQIILKKTTPRIWLPTLTLVWGVVATLLGVVQNYSGYLSSRFFLGVAESGLFPGVVFYLSMWYKRNEQHYRVALFFSAASLAGAFGGILAWVSFLFLLPDR